MGPLPIHSAAPVLTRRLKVLKIEHLESWMDLGGMPPSMKPIPAPCLLWLGVMGGMFKGYPSGKMELPLAGGIYA